MANPSLNDYFELEMDFFAEEQIRQVYGSPEPCPHVAFPLCSGLGFPVEDYVMDPLPF